MKSITYYLDLLPGLRKYSIDGIGTETNNKCLRSNFRELKLWKQTFLIENQIHFCKREKLQHEKHHTSYYLGLLSSIRKYLIDEKEYWSWKQGKRMTGFMKYWVHPENFKGNASNDKVRIMWRVAFASKSVCCIL